jgi:hypothetical protein
MENLSYADLQNGLGHVENSPANAGLVDMIVIRPGVDQRSTESTAELIVGEGLAGDNFIARGNTRTPDGAADPEAQVTIMNSRVVNLVSAGNRARWPLAGDQLLVDMDLSSANLPPGTRLAIGSAVVEVSAKPHTGCAKFAQRFGVDAAKWVNSKPELNLRGINAKVVVGGSCSVGDVVTKI